MSDLDLTGFKLECSSEDSDDRSSQARTTTAIKELIDIDVIYSLLAPFCGEFSTAHF